MKEYDFDSLSSVKIRGIDISELNEEEISVLYTAARYCEAMCDADIDTLKELTLEENTYAHMSGRVQTRQEYFADIANGALDYFNIGMENPIIDVDGDIADITYTSVLDANAYGAKGVYRMKGTHHFEKIDGKWISVNR